MGRIKQTAFRSSRIATDQRGNLDKVARLLLEEAKRRGITLEAHAGNG